MNIIITGASNGIGIALAVPCAYQGLMKKQKVYLMN